MLFSLFVRYNSIIEVIIGLSTGIPKINTLLSSRIVTYPFGSCSIFFDCIKSKLYKGIPNLNLAVMQHFFIRFAYFLNNSIIKWFY